MMSNDEEDERRDRVLLRPWLENMLETRCIPGLDWYGTDKTMFKVPWKHRSKKDWSMRHSSVFLEWAKNTGRWSEGDPSPNFAQLKTRLRCAFNKAPDIEEVRDLHSHKGEEPYKVYRFTARPDPKLVSGKKFPARTMIPMTVPKRVVRQFPVQSGAGRTAGTYDGHTEGYSSFMLDGKECYLKEEHEPLDIAEPVMMAENMFTTSQKHDNYCESATSYCTSSDTSGASHPFVSSASSAIPLSVELLASTDSDSDSETCDASPTGLSTAHSLVPQWNAPISPIDTCPSPTEFVHQDLDAVHHDSWTVNHPHRLIKPAEWNLSVQCSKEIDQLSFSNINSNIIAIGLQRKDGMTVKSHVSEMSQIHEVPLLDSQRGMTSPRQGPPQQISIVRYAELPPQQQQPQAQEVQLLSSQHRIMSPGHGRLQQVSTVRYSELQQPPQVQELRLLSSHGTMPPRHGQLQQKSAVGYAELQQPQPQEIPLLASQRGIMSPRHDAPPHVASVRGPEFHRQQMLPDGSAVLPYTGNAMLQYAGNVGGSHIPGTPSADSSPVESKLYMLGVASLVVEAADREKEKIELAAAASVSSSHIIPEKAPVLVPSTSIDLKEEEQQYAVVTGQKRKREFEEKQQMRKVEKKECERSLPHGASEQVVGSLNNAINLSIGDYDNTDRKEDVRPSAQAQRFSARTVGIAGRQQRQMGSGIAETGVANLPGLNINAQVPVRQNVDHGQTAMQDHASLSQKVNLVENVPTSVHQDNRQSIDKIKEDYKQKEKLLIDKAKQLLAWEKQLQVKQEALYWRERCLDSEMASRMTGSAEIATQLTAISPRFDVPRSIQNYGSVIRTPTVSSPPFSPQQRPRITQFMPQASAVATGPVFRLANPPPRKSVSTSSTRFSRPLSIATIVRPQSTSIPIWNPVSVALPCPISAMNDVMAVDLHLISSQLTSSAVMSTAISTSSLTSHNPVALMGGWHHVNEPLQQLYQSPTTRSSLSQTIMVDVPRCCTNPPTTITMWQPQFMPRDNSASIPSPRIIGYRVTNSNCMPEAYCAPGAPTPLQQGNISNGGVAGKSFGGISAGLIPSVTVHPLVSDGGEPAHNEGLDSHVRYVASIEHLGIEAGLPNGSPHVTVSRNVTQNDSSITCTLEQITHSNWEEERGFGPIDLECIPEKRSGLAIPAEVKHTVMVSEQELRNENYYVLATTRASSIGAILHIEESGNSSSCNSPRGILQSPRFENSAVNNDVFTRWLRKKTENICKQGVQVGATRFDSLPESGSICTLPMLVSQSMTTNIEQLHTGIGTTAVENLSKTNTRGAVGDEFFQNHNISSIGDEVSTSENVRPIKTTNELIKENVNMELGAKSEALVENASELSTVSTNTVSSDLEDAGLVRYHVSNEASVICSTEIDSYEQDGAEVIEVMVISEANNAGVQDITGAITYTTDFSNANEMTRTTEASATSGEIGSVDVYPMIGEVTKASLNEVTDAAAVLEVADTNANVVTVVSENEVTDGSEVTDMNASTVTGTRALEDASVNEATPSSVNEVTDTSVYERIGAKVNDLVDMSVNDVRDAHVNEVTYVSANEVKDVSVIDVTGAIVNEVTDANVNEMTDAHVNEVRKASVNDGTDARVNEVTYVRANKVTDASVIDVTDASVNNVTDASVNNVTDTSVDMVIKASVNEMTDARVNDVTDARVNEVTYVNANKVTDANAIDVTDASVNKVTDVSVIDVTDASVNDVTDASVNEVTDASVNEVTDVSVNDVTDATVNGVTDASVNEVTDGSVNEVTEASVNEITDARVNEMTDASVNEMTDVNVNEVTDVSVNDVTDTNMNQVTNASLNDVIGASVNEVTDATVNEVTDASVNEVTDGVVNEVTDANMNEVSNDLNMMTDLCSISGTGANEVSSLNVTDLTYLSASTVYDAYLDEALLLPENEGRYVPVESPDAVYETSEMSTNDLNSNEIKVSRNVNKIPRKNDNQVMHTKHAECNNISESSIVNIQGESTTEVSINSRVATASSINEIAVLKVTAGLRKLFSTMQTTPRADRNADDVETTAKNSSLGTPPGGASRKRTAASDSNSCDELKKSKHYYSKLL